MQILSFNVNKFFMKEKYNELDETKKEEIRNNINTIVKYIVNFLENGDDNLAILQEIPYASGYEEMFETFLDILKPHDYNIELPLNQNGKTSYFITLALSSEKSNWKRVDTNHFMKQSMWKEGVLYYNRVVIMENKGKIVVGLHIPSAYYDPSASVLWDDLIAYCEENTPAILIGDLNVDNDGTIQKRKFEELNRLGYEEAEGNAKKTSIGNPETCIYQSHIDYALVRKDVKVLSYEIDNKAEISDHYPIIISIKE